MQTLLVMVAALAICTPGGASANAGRSLSKHHPLLGKGGVPAAAPDGFLVNRIRGGADVVKSKVTPLSLPAHLPRVAVMPLSVHVSISLPSPTSSPTLALDPHGPPRPKPRLTLTPFALSLPPLAEAAREVQDQVLPFGAFFPCGAYPSRFERT